MALSPEARYQLRRAERLLEEREALRQRLLAGVTEAADMLRRDFGATRVVLFGSLLQPWFHEASDVDLAVEGVPDERIDEARERAEDRIGRDVDLVCLERADAGLRARIRETGQER